MDYKSLYEKNKDDLNKIHDMVNKIDELCENANQIISKLIKENALNVIMPLGYFKIAWGEGTRFINKLEAYKKLTSLDLDFNLNGDIDYYKGSNIRIIQYGKKFAIEVESYENGSFGPHYFTHVIEKFETLEEAQNYIVGLIVIGKVDVDDKNVYRYR